MSRKGLIIAAPSSGSGKTVFTLGLLRALARRGLKVASAKVGPDYIDPAFHAAASGRPCFNLDAWAMRPAGLAARIAALGEDADMIVCEGVMGLFDGADVPAGEAAGSTADVAALTGWPVLLLVNAKGQAASAAALVRGFAGHRPDVALAGVVFNQVGSPVHRAMIERACHAALPDLALLGWVPRNPDLVFPERHLGLVQAGEQSELDAQLNKVAAIIDQALELGDGGLERLQALARPACLSAPAAGAGLLLPPLGQRIAIARDDAFAFAYPGLLQDWRQAGAELSFFSPLADQGPALDADAVYLPGGYPELHGPILAAAAGFKDGMRQAAERGAWVYGECGGFMTLGEAIEDAQGQPHPMLGLLPLVTSFAKRRLHLGYRRIASLAQTPFGPVGTALRGHEFHYSQIQHAGICDPLFTAQTASGRDLGPVGMARNRVIGSYLHLIDRKQD